MKSVIQRVYDASVTVDGQVVGAIAQGLLVYLGVEQGDTVEDARYLSQKILKMRLFEDEQQKMNRCLLDEHYSVLVVSQFTLCADLHKGNRPSFNPAAAPELAQALYEEFVELVRSEDVEVATGVFGTKMAVRYTNDGPVTILLDSPAKKS